jgi:LacI family transcriptional regulator
MPPLPRARRRPHVALIIESSINYGRGLLRGIARYLRLHGPWSIFIEQREQYAALPPWIHRWRGDGIITRSDDPRVLALRLPTVALYDRVADSRGLPTFVVDNFEIGRAAALHLAERGFGSPTSACAASTGPNGGWPA